MRAIPRASSSWGRGDEVVPVSYTHLNTGTPWHKDDAFQLMPNIRRWDCWQTGLMSREEIEKVRASTVSYTHLDVYKRQSWSLPPPIGVLIEPESMRGDFESSAEKRASLARCV